MKFTLLLLFLIIPVIGIAQIDIQPEEEGFLFLENGKEVIFYQAKQKSKEGAFSRLNYFHPLWSPDGQVITEDFPPDHLHHRGIFWAWHQVLMDGNSAGDLWDLKEISQEITEVEFVALPSGAGLFQTEVLWSTHSNEVSPGIFMQENLKLTIHPKMKNYRRLDFEISLRALRKGVMLGGSSDEKGYGGFSVRMKLPPGVVFEGPHGIVETQVTQVHSPEWVNISGNSFPGYRRFGIVMLDHPENPGFPHSWILRREASMQNVVFPGRTAMDIPNDRPVVLKYSLLVYNGKLRKRTISRESIPKVPYLLRR